ncbi:MAG: response regulator [Planctomycetota bacterium]|jgi:YesN/AraC family two-component response regulator
MSYNILIIDDSVLTRVAIKRIIDMIEDIEVGEIYEAENGIDALEILENNQVGLVLADLNMPRMGGIELVERMKESRNCAGIPVVVISTESSVTRVKELLENGIVDYLHKPFTPEEFRSMLAKNLGVANAND